MNTPNYSKEVVKNRMYRHAMNYWGVKKIPHIGQNSQYANF